MAEFLKDEALAKEQNKRSMIRHADGTSTCLRLNYCEYTCQPCKQAKAEEIKRYLEARASQNFEEAKAL